MLIYFIINVRFPPLEGSENELSDIHNQYVELLGEALAETVLHSAHQTLRQIFSRQCVSLQVKQD